jgi:peroxiredoxin Q/BCP
LGERRKTGALYADHAYENARFYNNPFPFEIICDPEYKLYKKYNVFPADAISFMMADNRKEIMVYMATVPKTKPEGIQTQLPATFIIQKDNVITYADYASEIEGVPSVDELIRLL